MLVRISGDLNDFLGPSRFIESDYKKILVIKEQRYVYEKSVLTYLYFAAELNYLILL